jgi:S1-C subfamily serine protease
MKEFGGILVEVDDEVKVDMVMPPAQRSDEYKDLDIQSGDIIKMINGKKVSTVSALEDIFNKLAIGDEVKLGIFRGKEMMIVRFAKADPEKLPGKMMVIDGPGGSDGISISLIGCGIVTAEKEGKIIVEEIVDNMLVEFDGQTPVKGDVIQEIQGQSVTTVNAIDEIIDGIPVGEKVTLKMSGQDKEYTASFTKSKQESCSDAKQVKVKK